MADKESQEFGGGDAEVTLFGIQSHTKFNEYVKDCSQMSNVICAFDTFDKYIIDIDFDDFFDVIDERHVHQALISSSCVFEAERHALRAI